MQGKTANQLVAANARVAMDERKWSYEDVAQRLADCGLPQTRQNVHRKFRSEAGREATFTANDLLALSLVFEKPVVWFLLPQPHHRVVGPGEDAATLPVSAYLGRLFSDPRGDAARRLEKLGASDALRDQRMLHDHYVASELDDLWETEAMLRMLADRFSDAAHTVHQKTTAALKRSDNGPTYQEMLKEGAKR